MEDRHHLSEPRPVTSTKDSSLPTWEVDIFRDGVDTPIMTMIINNDSLPPRRRKKRVVWRLPDSVDQIPKFGTEDKKRIFDLYKQLKKERRRKSAFGDDDEDDAGESKDSNSQSNQGGMGFDEGDNLNGCNSSSHGGSVFGDSVSSGDMAGGHGKGISEGEATDGDGGGRNETGKKSSKDKIESEQELQTSRGKKKVHENGKKQLPPENKLKPPEVDAGAGDNRSVQRSDQNESPTSPISPPPPGFGMRRLSLQEPATQSSSPRTKTDSTAGQYMTAQNQSDTSVATTESSTTDPLYSTDSSLLHTPHLPFSDDRTPSQPHQRRRQSTPTPQTLSNDIANGSIPPPVSAPPGMLHQSFMLNGGSSPLRQFLVPPGASLAQVVTESYFMMLSRGMVLELASHYTVTAQKSLTVGGAHAICHQPGDRILQLKSLTGIIVQIKGTLQQLSTGSAIVVITTGTCLHPHALPFCHTLVLVPTIHGGNDNGTGAARGFRIQNDALCFLTSKDG